MATNQSLPSAQELAGRNERTFPNESKEYRQARTALLAQEIELRRLNEKIADMRRKLPPGGEVKTDFTFIGANGPVKMSELFGDKETLIIYSYMFGPKREEPCPMCTSYMSTWEKKIPDVEQRVALAFVARSPMDRLLKAKADRDWKNMKVYSDTSGDYTRQYVHPTDDDMPAYNVFTRKDGKIRHFWSVEMGPETADPGQDPRGAPDIDPLWLMLDTTPEGRGTDWYPKLRY